LPERPCTDPAQERESLNCPPIVRVAEILLTRGILTLNCGEPAAALTSAAWRAWSVHIVQNETRREVKNVQGFLPQARASKDANNTHTPPAGWLLRQQRSPWMDLHACCVCVCVVCVGVCVWVCMWALRDGRTDTHNCQLKHMFPSASIIVTCIAGAGAQGPGNLPHKSQTRTGRAGV
jgi:hypothetical protein